MIMKFIMEVNKCLKRAALTFNIIEIILVSPFNWLCGIFSERTRPIYQGKYPYL